MRVRIFEPHDEAVVIALWQACGLTRPWNDPGRDIARKLAVQGDGFLVGGVDGRVIASAMFGYDGHRGWVNYLAVAPDHQRRGYAAQLMAEGEVWLKAAGCPKLNLQVRTLNGDALGFYAKLGYAADDVVSLGKRLISDS